MVVLEGLGLALGYFLTGLLVTLGLIAVWKSGERTVLSFLLFPISHVTSREMLDERELATPPITSYPKGISPIETDYSPEKCLSPAW